MTRAEFASELAKHWMSCYGMIEGESFSVFAERTKNDWIDPAYPLLIAAVATNGFDPDPTTAKRWAAYCTLCKIGVAEGSTVPQIGAFMRHHNAEMFAAERAQESAKRSRPFVGSHKLPFDSDWD